MDWNEQSVVNSLFSSLSSPSACVSPSDPTLTVENVAEVMGEVGAWERVARGDGLRHGLDVPNSKLQETKQQSSSEQDKSCTVGEYWVNADPNAFWIKLARVLYEAGEERAAAMNGKAVLAKR